MNRDTWAYLAFLIWMSLLYLYLNRPAIIKIEVSVPWTAHVQHVAVYPNVRPEGK